MKAIHLIFIVPLLFFAAAALILDPGALLPMYPDRDLTGYLAAVSLAKDGDLAYTRNDSDRYLRDYGSRPFPFRVLQKKRMNSQGAFQNYYAFHYPEFFVFILAPFVGSMGFRGWLILHTLLVFGIYWVGWLYYRGKKDQDAISPALNSVIYFTLVPVPLLFLIPSHHLFLLATAVGFLFFGIRKWPVLCAMFFALAVSSQPWAALFGLFLIGYWQINRDSGAQNPIPKFAIAATVALFAVWGLERLMYPVANVSAPRWVTSGDHAPLAGIWHSLPDAAAYYWSAPEPQRVVDFLFGRNSGFFTYAFPAGALLLSSIWLFRDALVRSAWLFVLLYLAMISVVHTSGWNAESFAHDFWILLAALPYFVVPLLRPKNLFLCIAVPAALLSGPLLVHPLGAITNRSDYSFSFPYKFLPVEISLAGRAGITKEGEHHQSFSGGKIYLLNDSFYKEGTYFWLRGDSTLEFLFEVKDTRNLRIEFRNGVLENKITLKFKNSEEVVRLTTAEIRTVDVTRHITANAMHYEGKLFIHGEIRTNAGYVPGLLSRDNPDYRFLSCQVLVNP